MEGSEITRQAVERRHALRRQRKTAKWGMVASLGALVLTGYIRRRPAWHMFGLASPCWGCRTGITTSTQTI